MHWVEEEQKKLGEYFSRENMAEVSLMISAMRFMR